MPMTLPPGRLVNPACRREPRAANSAPGDDTGCLPRPGRRPALSSRTPRPERASSLRLRGSCGAARRSGRGTTTSRLGRLRFGYTSSPGRNRIDGCADCGFVRGGFVPRLESEVASAVIVGRAGQRELNLGRPRRLAHAAVLGHDQRLVDADDVAAVIARNGRGSLGRVRDRVAERPHAAQPNGGRNRGASVVSTDILVTG